VGTGRTLKSRRCLRCPPAHGCPHWQRQRARTAGQPAAAAKASPCRSGQLQRAQPPSHGSVCVSSVSHFPFPIPHSPRLPVSPSAQPFAGWNGEGRYADTEHGLWRPARPGRAAGLALSIRPEGKKKRKKEEQKERNPYDSVGFGVEGEGLTATGIRRGMPSPACRSRTWRPGGSRPAAPGIRGGRRRDGGTHRRRAKRDTRSSVWGFPCPQSRASPLPVACAQADRRGVRGDRRLHTSSSPLLAQQPAGFSSTRWRYRTMARGVLPLRRSPGLEQPERLMCCATVCSAVSYAVRTHCIVPAGRPAFPPRRTPVAASLLSAALRRQVSGAGSVGLPEHKRNSQRPTAVPNTWAASAVRL